jgi:hypothetical protein
LLGKDCDFGAAPRFNLHARSERIFGKIRRTNSASAAASSRIAQVGLAKAAVTLQKVGAYRDPRLYALNAFADRFSQSVQPLVPSRHFISNGAGNKPGDAQSKGSVLETLLSLILREKAGINIQENASSSKPLEEFIRQFMPSGSTGNGGPAKSPASTEKAAAVR